MGKTVSRVGPLQAPPVRGSILAVLAGESVYLARQTLGISGGQAPSGAAGAA